MTLILLSGWSMVCRAAAIEPGVDHELARWRAAHVSNVQYSVKFVLPATATDAYECHETISFTLNQVDDLLLDYQGEVNGRTRVDVNGQNCAQTYKNEHFVLPKRCLKRGLNQVTIYVENHSAALNRHDDYAYTLFVPDRARSAFPCFDQPDLKALFRLTLAVPEGWDAISNGVLQSHERTAGCEQFTFAQSQPLPTYLFSFTAGKFRREEGERDGLRMVALHRETDSARVAQLQTVFDQIAFSVRWMEDYTGIKMPFDHYDFAVLPGYQFGGMEHPGCVQFSDRRIFLGAHPTPAEQLSRTQLLAHETAHLWFGDLVTMRWFDDVWTKEVFANFMSDKISHWLYPDVNHDLNFLKAHYVPAMTTDRTDGTHPIQQDLPNLNKAGLLYGNIIYHKAPLMMRILEKQMGDDAFRTGLQTYLKAYSYGNATWDDLVLHLDRANQQAHVRDFDAVWVKQAGMPMIDTQVSPVGEIRSTQHDPLHRSLVWAQSALVGTGDFQSQRVVWNGDSVAKAQTASQVGVIPNYDGFGYGTFLVDEATAGRMMGLWYSQPEVNRYAFLLTLNENDLHHRIDRMQFVLAIEKLIAQEGNSLIAGTAIDVLQRIAGTLPQDDARRGQIEQWMWRTAQTHHVKAIAQQTLRSLSTHAVTPTVVDSLLGLWRATTPLLNERDMMRMTYHLAIVRPDIWQDILSLGRSRLTNDDRRREFDFISRGCNPDTTVQNALFTSLLQAENRAVEPQASALLALLNDPMREPANNRFITPGLDVLEEVQRTGDIFFPLNWCNALLGEHHSAEAREQVEKFINTHPDYPQALRGKLLQAAHRLLHP